MTTSDILNMSKEISQVNLNDPVEDSEAIKVPPKGGRLRKLQKMTADDDENESNNEQTIKMREAETASEAHSSANKNSGKKDSDKKRKNGLDELANYAIAMQDEEEKQGKVKKDKKKKNRDKKEKKNVPEEEDDDGELAVYVFDEDEDGDGNSGSDKMEEEEGSERKKKKKRDKSERRDKSEKRRGRSEKAERSEIFEEGEGSEEGKESGDLAEKAERPTKGLRKLGKKAAENRLFDDPLDRLAAKRKAQKEPKKTGEELLKDMRQDQDYTVDDSDGDIETERQVEEELERKEKDRSSKRTKKNGTIKTRNKLFADLNFAECIGEEIDDTPSHYDTYIPEEELIIAKPEKKKDMGGFLSTVKQYQDQKIRVPLQKSMSTIVSKPSQNSQASDLQVPTMENLPHSNSTPAQPTLQTQESAISGLSGVSGMIDVNSNPSSLPTLSAVPSTFERQGTGDTLSKEDPSMIRQKSVNFKSILSSSKVSIAPDDDRLIEVQVAVPHLQKAPALHSQNLADNTLFVNFLTKQQSFVNKNAIIGQWKPESNKKKDLKTLAAELSQKHTIKKSGNLTTEIIQSRFQVTGLNELEEKLNKNKKQSSAEKKENEEKDSDFNPDEPEKLGDEEGEGEDEFTFSGNPESGVESKQNSGSKGKKVLDVEDFRRLEEGEDFEGGDEEAEEVEGEEDEEEEEGENNEEDEEEEEKAENLELNKFDDVNAFNEVQEQEEDDNEEEQEAEERIREGRRLKTIGQKLLEKIKNKKIEKEQREKRRAEERKRREKAMREAGTYMEVEAELGSDNEGNDDFVKHIDKNDDEEDEEGLDEDLEELIDHAFNEDGDYNEGALNQYLKDLLFEDRENIKKVIQRSWNNKKRKRDQFEIEIDDEERTLKKMKRMEDIIKELEDDENKYFNVGGEAGAGGNKKQQEADNYFDEELALKKFELLKAEHQLKKSLLKRDSFEIKPKNLLITQDDEDDDIKKVVTMAPVYRKKTFETQKVVNNTDNKAGLNLFKQRTIITKGSILSAKDNPKNINLFNNKFNKDVLNEFGAKEGLFSSIEKKMTLNFDAEPQFNNENSNSNPFTFGKSKEVKVSGAGSSLNKLFTLKSSELKGPSPNKMFIFNGGRTKK